ncbi:DUF424 family protein [Candidatus Woesearchaeota archaeon]|nr:DUF424 family protein [Candidatus Woesearchaeota archaeon]MBW3006042.1 DUF424 family protein [Candidatus Woesearchaeota archaeon]
MIVKVHKKDERTVVAVCDNDLLGKKFEQGELQLDLTSDFYKGDEMDEKEAGDLMRNADIVNLVGKNSIKLGLEEGVIEKDHIMEIDGIPHAQAVIVHEE